MRNDPMCGGHKPPVKQLFSVDLLKLPFIGPWLCRLLGGGIGPKLKIRRKRKGGQYEHEGTGGKDGGGA
jgi:hypothetical protein